MQETDVSPPARKGPWEYFTRTFEGSQYALHGRRPAGAPEGTDETVLIDENLLAEGLDYFSLGGLALSPDQTRLAYAFDDDGGELHTLRFRELATGADLPDVIDGVYYGLAWANDNRDIFYVRPDDAMRPFQVWRHTLGDPDDVLVYEEADERFFVSVGRAPQRAGDPGEQRLEDHERGPAPRSGRSGGAAPRRRAPDRGPRVRRRAPRRGRRHRAAVHPHERRRRHQLQARPRTRSTRRAAPRGPTSCPTAPTSSSTASTGSGTSSCCRSAPTAWSSCRVLGVTDRSLDRVLTMDDPAYSTWIADNLEFDTPSFRLGYTSLVSPTSAFDETVATGERRLVKRTPVLGGFDPAEYTSARLWATAPDGVQVPMSVVHRKDTPVDGSAPALLYGYGSYESSVDPTFSTIRLSLLDRGFVFAIAHIRGGGELGRPWYEHGKLREKRNTFTDFIACAEHLCASGYTSPGSSRASAVAARAGSSWVRSRTCAPTCSAPSWPRCRSSTS